jgi:tetratricopeptide (TPR) repeat protein/predicted small secreted protein
MKKLLDLVLVMAAALALAASCATTTGRGDDPSLEEAIEQSAADIVVKLPQGARVAVVAFESPHQNLSEYIMDEIEGALASGSLEVADRNNLEYVYKELGFQMSGNVSNESAQSIGKFLGVRYVITGQLVHTGGRYRYRLNGINVETAIHESSTRLDVRNDRRFQELFAALQKSASAVRSASYGGTSAPRTAASASPTTASTPRTAASAPQTAGTFLDRGILFASRGEYDMAVADFTDAIDIDPDLQTAWMLRGRALYASVSRVMSVGANFSSVSVTTTGGVGVSEDKKAVYDRAIADFTQAIRLDPNNAKAYTERGDAYADKGDSERAIADYTQAIRIDPNYAWAYNNRGLSYNDKGEYDRAIADYTQAIRLDPNYMETYYNRGLAYYNKREYDRAIANYTQAIRLDPNLALAYSNRGLSYNDKMEYDRAIADYTQAIRLDPNLALAYSNRGVAYHNKGNYARARTDYEKALQLDPNNTTARNNLEELRGMGY